MSEAVGIAVKSERERCARLIEQMPLAEILLAAGEMTSGERLLVKSLKNVFARKIRNQ